MKKRILSSSSSEQDLEISRVYKRKKEKEKEKEEEEHENVDIISNLPEPILHHIFSFLDIKHAIHTCILSKRWRYFWVSLPTLNFNYKRGTGYLQTRNKNDFMDFVDRVLILRDSSNIHKLAVVVKEQCDIDDRLNTWTLTSVIRYLQELSLQIHTASNSMLILPCCLNNCESLTKLVLGPFGKCIPIFLPNPGYSTLPRVKTLILEAVVIDTNSNHLFVNEKCFPVLETLILTDVHFPLCSLKISFLKLKYLRIESSGMVCSSCPDTKHLVNIHLDSPNLISFYYHGWMFKRCVVKNLSSLVKADICVSKMPRLSAKVIPIYAQHTATILRELHNVEELTVSLEFLKIATGAPELLGNRYMQFLKLKCLKLEGTELSIGRIRLISYVLKASPNIEKLFVRLRHSSSMCNCLYCNEIISNSSKKGDCWGAGLSLGCLKFFELQNVRACVNELKFIKILLNKALALEKLFIVFGFEESSSDEKRCRVKFSEEVTSSSLLKDKTTRFFSSYPVLESLTVAYSIIHSTIVKISSVLFKHFVLEDCEGFGSINGSVKLCIPYLMSFRRKDYMEKNYALENLSSLIKANIYLAEDNELFDHPLEVEKNMYAQRMLKFLGALHNVTDLTLPAPILEVTVTVRDDLSNLGKSCEHFQKRLQVSQSC